MERIIEHLTHSKEMHEAALADIQKDIDREQSYIDSSLERIAFFQNRLTEAQEFIAQYDEAIARLSE